jgi:rod shape determining protein RodA
VVVSRRDRNPVVQLLRHVDLVLLATPMILAGIGAVMVYSATRLSAPSVGLSSHYYLEHQLIFAALGLLMMGVVALVDYRRLAGWGYALYGLVVLALMAVFVVGSSGNVVTDGTSVRWFDFGPLQIQPSEFGVLALIVVVALYCSRHQNHLDLKRVLVVLALAGLPMLLVMKQPDLGTTIVMGIVLATMLVVGGVRLRLLALFAVLLVVGVIGAVHFHVLHSYQLARIEAVVHQNSGSQDINYQKDMSQIAIGSGGPFGTGLFHGSQTNLGYVPNQDTDFIFTAVGEQLGFLGSSIVLGLFALVAFRIFRAIQITRDPFGRLLCAGVLAFLVFSVFQNVGMTVGIMPITGIPLPLISYGGSALFAFFAAIGLVLSVEMHRSSRRRARPA